jgi:hypothetical protein
MGRIFIPVRRFAPPSIYKLGSFNQVASQVAAPVKNDTVITDDGGSYIYDGTEWVTIKPPTQELFSEVSFSGAVNIEGIKENIQLINVAFPVGSTLNVKDASIFYNTVNSTVNPTFNFVADGTTSINDFLAIGNSFTFAVLITNGGTAYYPTNFQIDGTDITPKWQDGEAPTAGNAESIDVYSFTIFKTADATFTLLASQTKFA